MIARMSPPLSSTEYLDYRTQVGENQLLWENNGWSLRGTAGDLEILVWVSPYLLKGFDGGPFALDTAAVNQSLLIAVDPDASPDGLYDNDFISVGWEEELQAWASWHVDQADAGVTWRGPGREIVSNPPRWRISGDHAGVALDADITTSTAPTWLTDPNQTFDERQDRWFIAEGLATGTLLIDGSRQPLRAHAVHERHIHLGTAYDPLTLLRDSGVTWHTGHSDEVTYAVLARPSRAEYWGRVHVRDSEPHLLNPGDVRIEVVERWHDPRTDLTVPAAWRIRLQSDSGTLDLLTTALARAFYRWEYLHGGTTQLYWWLAETAGTLTTPGGDVHTLRPLRSEAHLNHTVDSEARI